MPNLQCFLVWKSYANKVSLKVCRGTEIVIDNFIKSVCTDLYEGNGSTSLLIAVWETFCLPVFLVGNDCLKTFGLVFFSILFKTVKQNFLHGNLKLNILEKSCKTTSKLNVTENLRLIFNGSQKLIAARCDNGVVPKWSRLFIEFSEFRESDKSLKHELGSI